MRSKGQNLALTKWSCRGRDSHAVLRSTTVARSYELHQLSPVTKQPLLGRQHELENRYSAKK